MAQRLIDHKKAWASTGGALSGLFGLISVPADIAFVTVLQLTLIMEIALVFRANLKSARARGEVFEVLGYSNGADTVNIASRAGPKIFARAAEKVLAKKGLAQLGRAGCTCRPRDSRRHGRHRTRGTRGGCPPR